MAVKARTEITLSAVRDVQATYRYYLLQSSTLSTPSKPTAQPPGGSWDDTEPSYTSGSTNSLYLVDCTVFSDGSFAYSDVSLSSSYEAAKAAYNKAQTAQDTAGEATDKAVALVSQWDDFDSNLTQRCAEIVAQVIGKHETITGLESTVANLKQTVASLTEDGASVDVSETTETTTETEQGDLQEQITTITKHFNFGLDGFTISSSEASTMLQLDSGKLAILDDGMAVTYVSDKCLYITQGCFTESLWVNGFGLVPRASGNLSFIKKVGD
jgi:hypothetical protein